MTPRRLSIGVACAALLMAACGSSASHTSGSASSTASGTGGAAAARTAVVTRTLAQGKTAGVDLDQDCVTKLVAQLSDDDATLLAASSADTSPTATSPKLSTAGEKLGTKILGCSKGSTNTALIEAAATKVLTAAGGSSLDSKCVHAKLATLTDATLQLVIDSGPDATGDQLSTVGYLLIDCIAKSATS